MKMPNLKRKVGWRLFKLSSKSRKPWHWLRDAWRARRLRRWVKK